MTDDNAGWHFGFGSDAEWVPWGHDGNASARIVGVADGFHQVLIKAQAGYKGTTHTHEHAEFSYVLDGVVRHNGTTLRAGDGYGAATNSTHDSFEVLSDATYLTVFRL